ncbi:putative NIF system FeS cluster assembly, NifU [Helianthus annuus]|nr:putative NIF system FeS cluster assembly, NifU [Helianthus annuus]
MHGLFCSAHVTLNCIWLFDANTFFFNDACGSFMIATEWVKGKHTEEVLTIKNTEIAKHLSLPPVKLHCSMLAEDAIKAAVKDYEAKRGKSVASTTD